MNTLWTYFFIFAGSFLAAAISGAAGFGGALLLLPLLSKTVGTTMAVPILTIAQLIGNLSRVFFGFKQIKWKPVYIFILGAVPMSVLGAFSFVKVPKEIITRGIGFAIIVFVTLKYFKVLKFEPSDKNNAHRRGSDRFDFRSCRQRRTDRGGIVPFIEPFTCIVYCK